MFIVTVYKDTDNIISSDCDSYFDDCPKVLVKFLCELTGVLQPVLEGKFTNCVWQ